MTLEEFMESLQDYGDEIREHWCDCCGGYASRWEISDGEWSHSIGWPTELSTVTVADGAVSSVCLDERGIDHSGIPLDKLLARVRRHVDRRLGRRGDP